MKCRLSMLSAAVLFALAGSSAEATAPAIRKSAHGSTAPARPSSEHRTAPAGGILYDQTAGLIGAGVLAADFTTSYGGFSSQGADDFVVPSGQTWTINGFVLSAVANSPIPAASGNPQVWSDVDTGRPGVALVCDGTNTPLAFANGELAMTLATPCVLPAGHYWLVFSANVGAGTAGPYWSVNSPAVGQPALWRNPAGGFGPAYSTWGDFLARFKTSGSSVGNADFAFQVIGTPGSATGGCAASSPTCLTVGMAPYDSTNPTECGTATSLSVTAGDTINYCYTFTNNTSISLDYHMLSDNIDGNLFTLLFQGVPGGGGSYQYNRTAAVNTTGTFAHTATWTAQNVPTGYSVSSSPGAPSSNPNFIDITSTGTALSLPLSDSGVPVTLPFSFSLYGQPSNTMCVNNNGFIAFDTTSSCFGLFVNRNLPTSALDAGIFPFWDDLGYGGDVYYGEPFGNGGPFVVEWSSMDFFGSSVVSPPYTFEVQLYPSGVIEFAYQQVSGGAFHNNGISATVGLQKDLTFANQFSVNSPAINDYMTLTWTPTSPMIYSAQALYTVNAGAPVAAVDPTALSGSAAARGTDTASFDITNNGNRDLIWSLGEAPGGVGNQQFPATPVRVTPSAGAADPSGIGPGHVDAQKHANALAAAQRHPPRHASGLPPVPAFGGLVTPTGFAYAGIDANNPGTLTMINSSMGAYFFAGTFASNDFSTEYAVSYPGGDLVAIDTDTGIPTVIGNTGFGNGVTGIRWDPTTGNTYAMQVTSCGSGSNLYTLDLSTGATTLIGPSGNLDCIIDIAIDPQGNVYGVDIVGNTLVKINKTTGGSHAIGSIGFNANSAQGMDFDQSTGTLYLAGFDDDTGLGSIFTVDLTTGLATEVGLIGPDGDEMDAFAIATTGGPCNAPENVPWLSEDNTSGTTAPGGSSTVNVTMDATILAGGTYVGNVCVATNDLIRHLIAVPVTFTVTGDNDTIFRDGFDGTP